MTPERTPGFLARARERLFGAEKHNSTLQIVLPSSPHFQQYYTEEFYRALYPKAPDLVQALADEYMGRILSPRFAIHRTTNEPVRDLRGEIEISTSSGASTIARTRLLSLINPSKIPESKARMTILVTSLDLLLASYFAKNTFLAIDFNRVHYPKDGKLETIRDRLVNISEGGNFRILTKGRNVDVTILPMPSKEDFDAPRFFLIGPQETNFEEVIKQATRTGKAVVFEAKKNQLELGLAFLTKFNPSRRIVTEEESSTGYEIYERDERYHSDHLPKPSKGNLDFIIYAQEGNVDEDVRSAHNSLRRTKGVVGVFGIDVVQTGASLRRNRLKTIEEILPIPCYPVQLRVV